MVELSLRKNKGLKKLQQKSKTSRNSSTSGPSSDNNGPNNNNNNNPYASLKTNDLAQYTNSDVSLPSIDKRDKAKMGKSMQRRMSIHQSVDLSKIYQQSNQTAGNVPALPTQILNQYQQQQGSLGKSIPQGSSNIAPQRHQQYQQPTSYTQPQQQLNNGSIPQQPLARPSSKGIDLQDQSVLRLLNDPQFNAESFITSRLADSTASDIEKFSINLTSLNNRVTNDLKKTAHKTYDNLFQVNEELNTINNELKSLRNATNELSEVTNAMKESAEKRVQLELQQTTSRSKSLRTSQRKIDRSSILVLEKMWATEMNSLFKHVEGAQKFISIIPGRHIIAESGRWYELNAATFKTLQPAHIFLLNDLILIATRKRKLLKNKQHNITIDGNQNSNSTSTSSGQSLVADQCWPLREVQLVELKLTNTTEENYAINITYNSLSYIYQTDRYDHYQKIIQGYKKARDELRDISEAENAKQKQLRDSMTLLSLSNHDESNSSNDSKRKSLNSKRNSSVILQDLSIRMHSRSRSLDNSNILKNLKQLDDQVDDVEILIFHQDFTKSISILKDLEIESSVFSKSCNEEELLYLNVINLKINSKKDEILKKSISTLNSINISSSELQKTVQNLESLHHTDIAITLFLSSRKRYIESLISKIQETKDLNGVFKINDYITEVSIVKFQNLRNSIVIYKEIFHKKSLDVLIDWSLKQVEQHVEFLKKALNNVKLTKNELEASILVIHRQVVQLKEVGIDVEFLIDEFYRSISV